MIEADDLLNQVEEIFFELASENLSEEAMSIVQTFPDALFLEIHENFTDDWQALVYETVEADEYIELGVYINVEGKVQRLALFLMALDMKNNKECHIQW